jgi:hypothetical protein
MRSPIRVRNACPIGFTFILHSRLARSVGTETLGISRPILLASRAIGVQPLLGNHELRFFGCSRAIANSIRSPLFESRSDALSRCSNDARGGATPSDQF